MFAEPSNLPDFAKVINMSPLPPQTHLYTTHTHTHTVEPQIPPPGVPQAEPRHALSPPPPEEISVPILTELLCFLVWRHTPLPCTPRPASAPLPWL